MKRGLYAALGFSATVRPAVTASRLAAPTTNVPKVNLGLSAVVTRASPAPGA